MTRAPLVALALLAGCNAASEAPVANETNEVANAVAPAAPAANAAAGHEAAPAPGAAAVRTATTIPAFHGEWNADLAVCASGLNDARLRIGPRDLRFFRAWRRSAAQTEATPYITIDADFEGEGESWTRRVRLSLSSRRDALTMDGLTGSAALDDRPRKRSVSIAF